MMQLKRKATFERKNAKTQPLTGTQSKKCENFCESLGIEISQRLGGNQNSQRLGIFKITASWQFNFGKYPKNNREKARPRPAYFLQFFNPRILSDESLTRSEK
jgi:hypothetical protein